jgi:hypothetical protein
MTSSIDSMLVVDDIIMLDKRYMPVPSFPISAGSKTDIMSVAGRTSIEAFDHAKNSRSTTAENNVISRSFSPVFKAIVRPSHRDT